MFCKGHNTHAMITTWCIYMVTHLKNLSMNGHVQKKPPDRRSWNLACKQFVAWASWIHRKMITSRHFPSTPGKYNFDTSHVIYSISCKWCDKWYVGEMKPFHLCYNNHKSCVQRDMSSLPVTERFYEATHSVDDMAVGIVVGSLTDAKQRQLEVL